MNRLKEAYQELQAQTGKRITLGQLSFESGVNYYVLARLFRHPQDKLARTPTITLLHVADAMTRLGRPTDIRELIENNHER